MKLFDILSKKAENDAAGEHRRRHDTRELEIYSGMRVLVEHPDGTLLFIAKLQNLQSQTAELLQYSEMEVFQETDTQMYLNAAPAPVKIRGYNENKRTAVFMEGMMIPRQNHVWQLEHLNVTAIENERSDPRLDLDIDAAIMVSNEAGAEETACRLLNISVGGACIALDHRYYKGDQFFLKADLFGDRRIFIVYCEVLRVIQTGTSRFEYGCQFLKLEDADQEQIRRLIAQAG